MIVTSIKELIDILHIIILHIIIVIISVKLNDTIISL